MPWMPFLLRWWRVGLYGLAALALGLAVWRVVVWKDAYDELPSLRSALEAEKVCGEGSACAARVAALSARQDAITEKVVSDYESELESLRNRTTVRRVIRVCQPAREGGLPDASGAGAASTPAADGLVHGADEFDTRPLRDLALRADEMNAAYRALYERDQALAAQPENNDSGN